MLLPGGGYQGHEEGQRGPTGDAHPACPMLGLAVSITSEGVSIPAGEHRGERATSSELYVSEVGIFRTREYCELLPNIFLNEKTPVYLQVMLSGKRCLKTSMAMS